MTTVLDSVTPAHARLLAGMHKICFVDWWDARAMGGLLAMPGAGGLVASLPGDAGADGKEAPTRDAEVAPAGFILWRVAGDEAEVLTLLVLPPYRRTGLGARLLEGALVRVRGEGAQSFFLEVAADNEPAKALYSAQGFERVGLRPRYYRNSIDALIMKRTL